MPVSTAQNLIDQALKIGGVFTADVAISGAENADALLMLNQVMEEWGQDALTSPFLSRFIFSLTSGQERYQLGTVTPGISLNTVVNAYAWLNNEGESIPLRIFQEEEYFQNKARTYFVNMPAIFFYSAFLEEFQLWPAPVFTAPNTASASIYYLTTPYRWATLATGFDLPDGWAGAIAHDLWVHLAPLYSMAPTEAQVTRARDMKLSIAQTNRANTVGGTAPQPGAANG